MVSGTYIGPNKDEHIFPRRKGGFFYNFSSYILWVNVKFLIIFVSMIVHHMSFQGRHLTHIWMSYNEILKPYVTALYLHLLWSFKANTTVLVLNRQTNAWVNNNHTPSLTYIRQLKRIHNWYQHRRQVKVTASGIIYRSLPCGGICFKRVNWA